NASGNVTIGVDPTVGPLASGAYDGHVTISLAAGVNNLSTSIPVSLALTKPTLTINPSPIVLGGTFGRSFDPVPVDVSLNTGSNGFHWSMSGATPWMQIDNASGTTSATAQTIHLTPLRDQSSPGTVQTNLTFSTTVNGDTVTSTVPASFNLDSHRLIASRNGIALVDSPDANWRRLTATVKVISNYDLPLQW